MIIVIGSEKGGTGKSTIATNLAAIRVNKGHDVLLVDTDKQGSASAWAATRENSELKRVPSVQKFGDTELTNELRDLAKRYEDVIVDAGGTDSPELRAAMLGADCIYTPVEASQFDIWTSPAVLNLIRQARLFNTSLQAFFVINKASPLPQVTDVDDVREMFEDIEDIKLVSAVIRERRAFKKAPIRGMAVTELPKPDYDKKAVAEMLGLYKEIFDHE